MRARTTGSVHNKFFSFQYLQAIPTHVWSCVYSFVQLLANQWNRSWGDVRTSVKSLHILHEVLFVWWNLFIVWHVCRMVTSRSHGVGMNVGSKRMLLLGCPHQRTWSGTTTWTAIQKPMPVLNLKWPSIRPPMLFVDMSNPKTCLMAKY